MNANSALYCSSCGHVLGGGEAVAAISHARDVGSRALTDAKTLLLSDTVRRNPWASAVVGALVAVVVGLLAAALIRGAVVSLVSSAASDAGGQIASSVAGGVVGSLLPNEGGMLLLMQGSTFHAGATGAAAGASAGLDATVRLPLTLLVLVPIFALGLGGWAAARYSRVSTVAESVLRGAMVAIPYAAFAVVISLFTQVGGSTPLPAALTGGASASVGASVGVDWLSAALTSLLLASAFASLGALVGARGRGALREAGTALSGASIPFRDEVEAALHVVLVELGVGLAVAVLLVVVAATGPGFLPSGADKLALPLALVLPWLTIITTVLSNGLNGVAVISGAGGGSFSLWQLVVPMWGLPLLLLAVPVVMLMRAGRRAARSKGLRTPGEALLQGVRIAIPYSMAVVVLAYVSVIRFDVSGSLLGLGAQVGTGFIGVSVWSAAIVALIASAAAGAIGALSVVLPLQAAATRGAIAQVAAPVAPPVAPTPGPVPGPQAGATVACPACGYGSPPESAFCEECGSRLSTGSVEGAIADAVL